MQLSVSTSFGVAFLKSSKHLCTQTQQGYLIHVQYPACKNKMKHCIYVEIAWNPMESLQFNLTPYRRKVLDVHGN